jgi:CBS domain-containing protein
MSAGEYCNREVVVVEKTESLREAVNLMRSKHVGDVVVVDRQGTNMMPLGILTDRDLVIEVLARDVDMDSVVVGDVMSFDIVSVTEDTKLIDAIKVMRNKGIRRLPVVNTAGGLEGILTVDDVLELLAEQISDLIKLVSVEQHREHERRK